MTTHAVKTIIYPVKDIARAKTLFTALVGAPPQVDEAYYVGYDLPGQHIGLDPNGHEQGATAYWHVDDIGATSAALVAVGATVHEEAHDVGGGRLVAQLRDADGNVIGLIQG
ncbi:MAG: glyoxalase [Dehalococcoidia bacterium]|nr:glyoxalase [Dehalococcoidia bacterium]